MDKHVETGASLLDQDYIFNHIQQKCKKTQVLPFSLQKGVNQKQVKLFMLKFQSHQSLKSFFPALKKD